MHFSTVIEIYTVVHPWRKASVIVKPWQSEPVVAFRQTLWTSRKERETLGSRTNLTDLDACELRWFSGGSLNLVTNPKSLLSYPLCTLRKYSTIMSCSDQLQTPVYNLAPLLWPMPISHANYALMILSRSIPTAWQKSVKHVSGLCSSRCPSSACRNAKHAHARWHDVSESFTHAA